MKKERLKELEEAFKKVTELYPPHIYEKCTTEPEEVLEYCRLFIQFSSDFERYPNQYRHLMWTGR